MEDYSFFNLPQSSYVGSTIFKRFFYENPRMGKNDKRIIREVVNRMTWLYSLQPETINIIPYKDEEREYSEIQIIEVVLYKDSKLKRLAEIMMREIPYPMVLIFKFQEKIKFNVAHQRISLIDSSKNTLEEIITTNWLEQTSLLFSELDFMKFNFTSFYALYTDIVDVLSIYNFEEISSSHINITGEEARLLANSYQLLQQEINQLRSKLKKETQFNHKMEINIKIKALEKDKRELLEG